MKKTAKNSLLVCLATVVIFAALTLSASALSDLVTKGFDNTDSKWVDTGFTDIDDGEGWMQITSTASADYTVGDDLAVPSAVYASGFRAYYNLSLKKIVMVTTSGNINGSYGDNTVRSGKVNEPASGIPYRVAYFFALNCSEFETVELRNGKESSYPSVSMTNFGYVMQAFTSGITTVIFDNSINSIRTQNSTSTDRGYFRKMGALTTVAHVDFSADGSYDGALVTTGVADLTGFDRGLEYDASSGYCVNAGTLENATSVKEVILPAALPYSGTSETLLGTDNSGIINISVFSGTTALEKVTLPANSDAPLAAINSSAFKNSGIKELHILRSVSVDVTVDSTAFTGVSDLVIYVLSPSDAARLRAALPDGADVTVESTLTVQNELTFEGYQIRTASYNGLRTLFRYDDSVKAVNEANGFEFVEYGVVAVAASKFKSICNFSMEEALAAVGTNGIIGKAIERADGTGENKFVNIPNKTFCLALVNMKEANYMDGAVVFAYSKWKSGDETICNYTWCDTTSGEMSLYDATMTLFKRGLINSETTKDADTYCEENYLWKVLSVGAYKLPQASDSLPSATVNGVSVSAAAGYEFTDGYFTYLDLPYHTYTPTDGVSYGYGFSSPGLEAQSSTGISWSLLADGDNYVVVYRDSNGDGESAFPAISLGQYKYYMPHDKLYGTPNAAMTDYTIYSPRLPSSIASKITTMVIDQGITNADSCYTFGASSASNASIETVVYPESFKSAKAQSLFMYQSKLQNIIYAARDKSALSAISFNGEALCDMRGITNLNLNGLFNGCSAIQNAVLPAVSCLNVASTPEYLFSGCSSLLRAWTVDVEAPTSGIVDLTAFKAYYYGKEAFNFLSDNITDVYISETVCRMPNYSFTSSANAKSFSRIFGDDLSYTLHTGSEMLSLLIAYYDALHASDSTYITSNNYQDNVDYIKVEIDDTTLTIKEWKELYTLNSDYEINLSTSRTVGIEGATAPDGTVETAAIYDETTGKTADTFAAGDLGFFSVDLKSGDTFGIVTVAICDASDNVLTSMNFKITSQEVNTCLRFTATGNESYVKISQTGGSASKITFANPTFYHSSASSFTFVKSGYYMKDDGSWTTTQYKYADYYTTTALASQIETCNDVLVNGNYLYAISSRTSSFYSFDITDPENPVFLDSIGDLGDLRQMEFTSDRRGIVAVARSSSTYIFDITAPANLKMANRIENLEFATGVDVSGNYCAIADRSHGVTIFDISDMYNPVGVSNVSCGETQDVDIYGNYIYCGIWGDQCIRVIDITDVDNPVLLTELQRSLFGRGDGLTVRDGYLYAATGHNDGASTGSGGYIGNGFEIWDVRDPSNPTRLSVARFEGAWYGQPDIWKIEISGNIAYACGSYNGVYIYDVTNKKNPVRLEHVEIVAKTTDDRYAANPNQTKYPYPYDVANEAHSAVYQIACTEGYMYIAGVNAGLFIHKTENAHVLDIKDCDPVADVSDGSYYDVDFAEFGWSDVVTFDTEGTQAWGVATNGEYLYVASGIKGIRVLDKSMKQIYIYPTLDITMDVKIAGDVLVTAECDGGIAVYTINDDGSLTFNSTTQTNKSRFWYSDGTRQIEISPNSKYVVAYSNAYMVLYNISSLTSITSEYYNNRAMIYQRFIGFGASTVENEDGTHTDYIVSYMGNSGTGAIFKFEREAGTWERFDWKTGLANNKGLCAYGDKMLVTVDENTVAMFSPAVIAQVYGASGATITTKLVDMPEVTLFTLEGETGAQGPISVANGYLFIQGGSVSNMRVVDLAGLESGTIEVIGAMDTRAMAGYAIEFNGKTVLAMGFAGVVSFTIE